MVTRTQGYNGADKFTEAGKVIDKLRLVEKLNNNINVPLSAIKCNIDYLRDTLESKHDIITVVKNDRLEKWNGYIMENSKDL